MPCYTSVMALSLLCPLHCSHISVFDISAFATKGVSAHPCSRRGYRQHPNTSEEIKVKFIENLGADIKKKKSHNPCLLTQVFRRLLGLQISTLVT